MINEELGDLENSEWSAVCGENGFECVSQILNTNK